MLVVITTFITNGCSQHKHTAVPILTGEELHAYLDSGDRLVNSVTSALPAPSCKDSSRERRVRSGRSPNERARKGSRCPPRQLIGRHSFVFTEERPVGLSEEASLPRGFRKELH